MKTATLRRPVRKPSVPRTRGLKAAPHVSPHILEATERGFPPPYRFSQFAGSLFAFRAMMHSEDWWLAYARDPQSVCGPDTVWGRAHAHARDPKPVGGPDAVWGRAQFLQEQQERGVSGWKQLRKLGRAWRDLGTEDHRARALVLLWDASSEARQKKTRGAEYWKKTKGDRAHKQKALHDARQSVEARGAAFIAAIETYLVTTRAVAPFAREQLSFPTSRETQEQAVMAECENPLEIAACINPIQEVIARLNAIQDYEAAPKGPEQPGREESTATNTAMWELDRMFQQNVPTLYQAEQYTHGLLYVAGIWPRPEQHSMTGTLHRLRATRP